MERRPYIPKNTDNRKNPAASDEKSDENREKEDTENKNSGESNGTHVITNETAQDFYQHMGTMVVGSFVTLGMALGSRLGMFELMAKFKEPKTSQEIADAGGFKERYVREWLGLMSTGDIVEIDDSGERYWIPEHRHQVLTDPSQLATFSWALPIAAGVEDDVFKCFQKDGPQGIPYSRYPMFHEWRDQRQLNQAEWGTLEKSLKLIPGLLEQFDAGIEVCDMGTSTGRIPLSLANRFPKSTVWGLDCSDEAITTANKLAAEQNLTNVRLHVQDICKMPAGWSDKWDFISMFDVAHDVAYTSRMMREILRTLKPGAYFLMLDIGLRSRHKDNIDNPMAPLIYAMSLFHCMPVSLNEPGGEGLGAAWGQEKACQMLTDAGFEGVKINTEFLPDMVVTCRKPLKQ